jgi:hypothetical protein
MTFAIAGIFGWLLISASGICLATAAHVRGTGPTPNGRGRLRPHHWVRR